MTMPRLADVNRIEYDLPVAKLRLPTSVNEAPATSVKAVVPVFAPFHTSPAVATALAIVNVLAVVAVHSTNAVASVAAFVLLVPDSVTIEYRNGA
jgi:hypothetical protein